MNELIKKFDDIVTDEDGHNWSQVCEKHKEELYMAAGGYFDYAPDCGVCGVASCLEDADHYIDF